MQFDALATLRHLNIRKEGDEKVLAYDLKIEVETSSDVLIEFHPSLPSLLWADSEPRFKGLITSVRLSGELRHHCARVASIEIADCTLKNFEVTPHAMDVATLTFTLTAKTVSGLTIALLSEFVQDKVSLHLSSEGDLFAPPAPATARAGDRPSEDEYQAAMSAAAKALKDWPKNRKPNANIQRAPSGDPLE